MDVAMEHGLTGCGTRVHAKVESLHIRVCSFYVSTKLSQ
jgi:hypothetical protein